MAENRLNSQMDILYLLLKLPKTRFFLTAINPRSGIGVELQLFTSLI